MSKDSSSLATHVKPSVEPVTQEKTEAAKVVKLVPWSPWAAVIITIVVYYVAQYVASILLFMYPRLLGWNNAVANNWLNNSVVAQFFYVLFAEGLMFGAIWWFIRRRHSSLRELGWRKIRLQDPLYTLAGFVVYYVGYLALLTIAVHIFPSMHVNQKQQLGFQSATSTPDLILTFISLVVLPPLVEETVFRGFVFSGLWNKFNWVWAALFTSILFATAHLELGSGAPPLWVAAIDTFTLSMVLCYLRQKTGSLWPGILLHLLKNGIAFVTLFILHVN